MFSYLVSLKGHSPCVLSVKLLIPLGLRLLHHPVVYVFPAFFGVFSKGQLLQVSLIELLAGFLKSLQMNTKCSHILLGKVFSKCENIFFLTCFWHKCLHRAICTLKLICAINQNVQTPGTVPGVGPQGKDRTLDLRWLTVCAERNIYTQRVARCFENMDSGSYARNSLRTFLSNA